MNDYNGYRNRATWNVALWVANDESLYRAAVDYVAGRAGRRVTWGGFVAFAGLAGVRTPDRFAFDGRTLDRVALAECLTELARD